MGDRIKPATEHIKRVDAAPKDAKEFNRDLRRTVKEATVRATVMRAQADRPSAEASVPGGVKPPSRSLRWPEGRTG